MLSDKRYFVKFFFIHFLIVIPLLVTSIVGIGIISGRMVKIEQQLAVKQLNSAVLSLEESYLNYCEESVLLSEMPELRFYNIIRDVKAAAEGIEVLKLKQYFDNRIESVFMEYGSDLVYSSARTARKKTYFKSILRCGEESLLRGLSAIESDEEVATFLYRSDTSGYILYNYPVHQKEDEHVSVNFVLPFQTLIEMFEVSDSVQWYRIQAADGSVLHLGCDDSGNTQILSQEVFEVKTGNNSGVVFEEKTSFHGMTVRLYYKKMSFSADTELYQMQIVNMLLIVLGVVLSSMISWSISERRIKEIRCLENIAKGEVEYPFHGKNVYSRLQNIISEGLHEARILGQKVSENALLLKERTAYVIFHGLIQDAEKINQSFQELGLVSCPEHFFVGAIHTQEHLEEDRLPPELKKCLLVHMVQDSGNIILFLCGLQTRDENRIQRKKFAEDIRRYLRQKKIRGVQIGMSQVYTSPLKIDCARSEAIDVLQHLIAGEMNDFCGCWETVKREATFILPQAKDLQNFTEALGNQNFEDAKRWFYHVLHGYGVSDCRLENQIYIRFTLMQCLIDYLNQKNTVESKLSVQECLNVNLSDEKRYIKTMIKILDRCLIKPYKDSFSQMLDFIENNYWRSDLTYKEVAEAGGITETYVSKLFRTRLGMSYVEYLASVRIDRACTLLRTTDYSIADIAKSVGYESTSSFCRNFKEKCGVSATDYRKECLRT